MTKIQQLKDSVHNFAWWVGIVAKVVMFQIALALMVMGVFYVLNFTVTISPMVKVISPIVEMGGK